MAASSAILDQFGRPIQKRATKPYTELVRIRRPQPLSAQTTMSVEALAQTMYDADEGDIEAYMELATEMEERDLHYFGQLQTRKLTLVGAPVVAVAGDGSGPVKGPGSRLKRGSVGTDKTATQGQIIARAWQDTVLEADAFPGLINDFGDALGKSLSVVQAMWDTSKPLWGFSSYEHIPSESLTYFPALQQKPQAVLEDTDLHLILQDGKYARIADLQGLYVIHKPGLRTGATMRGGFARIAARSFLLKNFTVKEWLAFMEVYGMPLRYARYDPETITEEEKLTIAIALANLGHDASAMIPRSVELEILGDAARTGQGDGFDRLCRYLDEQMSKAILGQTMTADNGSSQSQATVHNEVRIDYKRFDAIRNQGTVGYLADAWTVVNYGPAAPAPRTRFAVEPPADLTNWTTAVLPWVTAGLKVSRTQVLDKLDLSEPEDEGDVIELTPPAPPPGADGQPGQGKPKPAKGKQRTDTLSGWDSLIQPHVDELEAQAAEHTSYEEFLAHLELKPSNPLVERLVLDAILARTKAEREG